MRNSNFMDFYRGWMIEVIRHDDGFQSICRSPVGEKRCDQNRYSYEVAAWQAGIRLVDQASVTYSLKLVLRELYEVEKLTFDEWQALGRSWGLPQ